MTRVRLGAWRGAGPALPSTSLGEGAGLQISTGLLPVLLGERTGAEGSGTQQVGSAALHITAAAPFSPVLKDRDTVSLRVQAQRLA